MRRLAPLAALAALLAALPAGAQTGNQTDVPIAPPPGGVGGSFLGPGARFENELLARSADRFSFRNDRAACAVRTAERAWADSVAAAGPRTPGAGRVDALLRGRGDAGAVAGALGGGDHARDLAGALDGLLDHPGGCEGGPYPEGQQWGQAVSAYREYMRSVPDSVLAPTPPEELLAIHDLLESVVRRSLAEIHAGG
ncbi:MAG TPA: hypothetical protein VF746_21780 [Longimicrobium sp.]|jgi:hypothetical protein